MKSTHWRYSLGTKLIINVVVIHIFLMGFVVLDMTSRETEFISDHVAQRGKDITEILAMNSAIALLNNDVVALDEQITQAKRIETLSQIYILDLSGRVLAANEHTYLNTVFVDDESTSLIELLSSNAQRSAQLPYPSHTDTLAKITVDDDVIGYARTVMSKQKLNQQLETITVKGFVYIAVAILLGVLFAWLTVKSVTRNLRLLTEHAHKLADHKFDSSVPEINDRGELQTLAQAFSVMQTSLHNLIEQNKQNELRWRLALNAEGNGVWDWDISTNEVYFSDTWKQILGYEIHEIGTHVDEWSSRVHPDDIYNAMADIQRHIEGKSEIYKNQHRMRCKDGQYIWILDQGLIIERDSDNKPTRMIGTHTDINSTKTIQQALVEAKHKAELASRAKSAFVANMSHEIRTPMAGVLGLIGLVMKTDLTEQQRFYLERTERSATTLLGILNDILDYSKVEAGKLQLENTSFSVRELVSDVIELFKPKAEERELIITLKFSPDIPDYHFGDPLRITQVLNNLIGNAIKFTKQGYIELSVSAVTSHHQESHLYFAVSDTGIGIDSEQLTQIFKPFHQASNTSARYYGGTGLGLHISNQLINLMGGNIEVQSEVGKGSTFSFTVTLQVAKNIETPNALIFDSQPKQDHFDAKVLLVEDNEINELIAKSILAEYGLDIVCAHDGSEAIECFEKEHFSIIFMDLHMPRMDGFKATEIIRRKDPDIPIVALSAAVLDEEVERTRQAGMNAHLAKPIERDMLAAVLRQFLSK